MHTNAWGQTPSVTQNHTIDSLRWKSISLREGDVVISSWAKSGTTWIQQLVSNLLFGIGRPHLLPKVCPWVESRYVPEIRHAAPDNPTLHRRRAFKSHLDAIALPYCPNARYIYLARDGRDVAWSWYRHHRALRPIVYAAMIATVGRADALRPTTSDFGAYFSDWLEKDGYPLWPFWSHLRSWWALKDRPNVLVLNYNDIRHDPYRTIKTVADFLELEVSASEVNTLLEVTSKTYMAKNIAWISPDLAVSVGKGGREFFYGTEREWRDFLSREHVTKYLKVASSELGGELFGWLHGRCQENRGNPSLDI